MNVYSAIGNIGRDAMLRSTPSGTQVLNFSVAVQSGYGDNKKTNWVGCTLWGKRAEALHPYLKKGVRVGITGEISLDSYERDGQQRAMLACKINDVTLCSAPANGQQNQQHQAPPPQQQTQQPAPQQGDFANDIPF